MNRLTVIISVLAIAQISAFGQEITYNHDASKQNQISVMELGTGDFTPSYYYQIVHNSYAKGAKGATSVKNNLRMSANTASYPQVAYADSIQADLESRAKVEAANVADRQMDAAWLAEGGKIESRLLNFKNNINALTGKANIEEITGWMELCQMYDFAIQATRKAYMPNSERQQQYLTIYDEIVKSNDQLLLRVRFLTTKAKADKLVTAMSRFPHRVTENATAGFNRWRDAGYTGSGKKTSSTSQTTTQD